MVEVKVYSCYQHTYKRIYHKVIKYLYGDSFKVEDITFTVIDISDGGTKTVQSQRSMNQYITRALYVYEDGVLKHIVGTSNTNKDYDKKHEKELNPSFKYIFNKPENDYHGNAYFKQGTPKLFNLYFELKKEIPDLKLSFYLFDVELGVPSNLFNCLTWRELQTIGFRVLNIDEIDFKQYEECGSKIINKSNIAFSTLTKYINDIALISAKNKGNKPSFLQIVETMEVDQEQNEIFFLEKYIYTFKSLSAQGYDALFRVLCLKTLADKESHKIEFRLGKQYFAYSEKELKVADKLTKPIEDAMKNFGCSIHIVTNEEFLLEKNLLENAYLRVKHHNNPRNQTLFRNNLYKKGMPIKCVLCGNDDPSLLKAAHLWEVNDIKNADARTINNFIKNNSLEGLLDNTSPHKGELFYKKYCLTNSGDNGVWMCGTHHDMFDRNYFTFKSSDGGLHILHFKTEDQKNAFLDSLPSGATTSLHSKIFNTETAAFISARNIPFSI